MTSGRLAGKRILITSADDYMGPPIVELFTAEGADVIADTSALLGSNEPAELIERCGHLDGVIANLDYPANNAHPVDIDDEVWLAGFAAMVHPLMRLVRAAAPQMIERGSGTIVGVTSSAPLRRKKPAVTAYVAARAAQNAFVRSAGQELAADGVRFNTIAQNFVANETYYPPDVLANPKFQARLEREVPAKRIGQPHETAELALFLTTEQSSFAYGQIFSHDGGWS
jgi:2-keto-3-deoxy-L-fuconate dehydrogenase